MTVPGAENHEPHFDPELEVALQETEALFKLRDKFNSHRAEAESEDAEAKERYEQQQKTGSSIKRGGRRINNFYDPEDLPDTYVQMVWEPNEGTFEDSYISRIAVRHPIKDLNQEGSISPMVTNAIFIELELRAHTKAKYLISEEGIYAYEDARETVHKTVSTGPDGVEEWYYFADKNQWHLPPIKATTLQDIISNCSMIEQT